MARKIADNAKDFHADAAVNCAHESCNIPAMYKIHTKTGWANLCIPHYDKHFADQAIESLDKYGMAKLAGESRPEWVVRMRQFVKKGFKNFANKQYE